jgi:type IV secretory pathway TrbL component
MGCGRSPTDGTRDAAGTITGAGGAAAGGTGGSTTGGSGGGAAVYTGCSYIGGYDRAVVVKFDPQTGTCVALLLMSPMRETDASAGLTITSPWGLMSASMWRSTTDCQSDGMPSGAAKAISASGNVTVNWSPASIDIDAIVTFQSADGLQSVELKAQGLDIDQSC